VIEVFSNLFVGAEWDEQAIHGQTGWFVIHACKEPWHSRALGYSPGKAAPKGPEYFFARREGRLILNLIDAPNVNFIPTEIIAAAVDAIQENIGQHKVLVHCNQGQSRSPSIAFLYLLKFSNLFAGQDLNASIAAFQKLYPPFNPGRGMADFVRVNSHQYAGRAL
jgi:hypothetical protein